jgi:hypothetical protein
MGFTLIPPTYIGIVLWVRGSVILPPQLPGFPKLGGYPLWARKEKGYSLLLFV